MASRSLTNFGARTVCRLLRTQTQKCMAGALINGAEDMGDRKRSKPGSGDSEEEEKSVDWAKEYLKGNEELKQALRLNIEFAVKNRELEKDMAIANTELLKMRKALSARGTIELLESQQFSSAPPYCTSRQLRYEWLYNNSKTFENNVRRYVQSNIPGKDVGLLAKDLYASASHDIHTSFNYGSEIVVRRSDYQRDQLKLLEAICQTLNVRIKKL